MAMGDLGRKVRMAIIGLGGRGVGQMTIAMLLANTLDAAAKRL